MARDRAGAGRGRPDRQSRRYVRQRRFVRLVSYWTCIIALGVLIGFAIRSWREPKPALAPPVTVTAPPMHVEPTGQTVVADPTSPSPR